MFLNFQRDDDMNIVIHDTHFKEIVENSSLAWSTIDVFKIIISVYKKRGKFSSKVLARIYYKYYGIENLRYMSAYIKNDSWELFSSKEDIDSFIPCAANYVHYLEKEIAFRGR